MHMIAWFRAALARRAEARGFDEGFHGEARRWFRRIGPGGVRQLIESRQLNCVEHTTAELWLAHQDRIEALRGSAVFVMTVIGVLATIANLVVNLSR
jgi:hypothetical protein